MSILEELQFYCASYVETIDGNRWEQLISSLLPHLTKFQFIFELPFRNLLLLKISRNFRRQKHQCFTPCQSRQYLTL